MYHLFILQLVYVSMGASRPQKKKESMEYSSSLPPPPRDKLPVTLLLQPQYFEQLFCLMQSLSEIKTTDRMSGVSNLTYFIICKASLERSTLSKLSVNQASVPHTKAQVLSRRVWDILMLLPTNPSIHEGFTNIGGANQDTFRSLLDPLSPQKLMYSLYIVEALVKMTQNKKDISSEGSSSEANSWKQQFVERGGLRHLFEIFSSGILEAANGSDWSEWKQDCLASLLKILCYLGVVSEDTEYLNEQLYDVNEPPKKRVKRRKISTEKSPIPRLNEVL
jgi:ubiquitin carboxyl-terminal hydrolase 34